MKLRLGKKRKGKPISERIEELSMPEPNSGCWIWIGAVGHRGYGILHVDGHSRPAPRMSCEAVRGPIPRHLVVDHLCCNPICVNPDHLEPVTESENLQRRWDKSERKKRSKCFKGHEYTVENTILRENGRCCRICNNIAQRNYYHRTKAKRSVPVE